MADETKALATVADYGGYKGEGYENQTSHDTLVPYLNILQALSPEISNPSKKIKGAEAGMLFNSVTKELYDPAKGVIFQPCGFRHTIVEWRPRAAGGGRVGERNEESAEVQTAFREARDRADRGGKWALTLPNGNELRSTYYVVGLIHQYVDVEQQITEGQPVPVLISFSSTKVNAFKQILTTLLGVAGRPPLFAHRILLQSVSETNKQNQSYFNWKMSPVVSNNAAASLISPKRPNGEPNPLLEIGQHLKKTFNAGQIKDDAAAVEGGDSEHASDSNSKDDLPI